MRKFFDLSFMNRNIGLIIYSRGLSRAGDIMEQLAFVYLAYKIYPSAYSMGLIMFFSGLGNFIAAPFVGVIVDKFNNKKLMILSEIIRFSVLLFLGIMTLLNYINITILIIVAIISSIGESIFESSALYVVRHNIEDGKFDLYSSYSSFINTVLRLIAIPIAGVLIDNNLYYTIFFFDAFTFLISAICVYFIKNMSLNIYKDENESKQRYSSNFIDSLKYLLTKKDILLLFFISIVITVLFTPISSFLPIITSEFLNTSNFSGAILKFMYQIGIILSLSLYSKILRNKLKIHSMNLFLMLILSGTLISFIIFGNLASAVVLFFIVGSCAILLEVTNGSRRIEMIDKKYIGRITSINTMILYGISPLSSLAFGYIIDIISIQKVVLVCAIILAVFGLVIYSILKRTITSQDISESNSI
ncbi:MAG: MFS transporter [Clostridium sp.]|nr:MFS transporter [Clostridium sp.]